MADEIAQVLEMAHYNTKTKKVDPSFYRPEEMPGFYWQSARTDDEAHLLRGYWMPIPALVAQMKQKNRAWARGQYGADGKWIDGKWVDRKALPDGIFESEELKEIEKVLAIVEENKATLTRIESRLS